MVRNVQLQDQTWEKLTRLKVKYKVSYDKIIQKLLALVKKLSLHKELEEV